MKAPAKPVAKAHKPDDKTAADWKAACGFFEASPEPQFAGAGRTPRWSNGQSIVAIILAVITNSCICDKIMLLRILITSYWCKETLCNYAKIDAHSSKQWKEQ